MPGKCRGSYVSGSSGMALVELLVGFTLGMIVVLALVAIMQFQDGMVKSIKITQTRDSISTILLRMAGGPEALARSAAFTGSGGFPGNDGAFLSRCVNGGINNGCTSNTSWGFTLTDAYGNPVAGPGPTASGNVAVYSVDGVLCGSSTVVTPDSARCPLIAYSTYKAVCAGGSASCTQAQSIIVTYTVGQASGVALSFGRLKSVQFSIPTTIPLQTGLVCPLEMTLVGNPNMPQAFCIDTEARASAPFNTAVDICSGVNAHVCTPDEWTTACVNTSLQASMTAWGDYVAGHAAPNYDALGEAIAKYGHTHVCLNNLAVIAPYVTTRTYRCCKR